MSAVEKIRAALEPFANASYDWVEMGDTRPISEDDSGTILTVADLRAAKEALAALSEIEELEKRNAALEEGRWIDGMTLVPAVEFQRLVDRARDVCELGPHMIEHLREAGKHFDQARSLVEQEQKEGGT